MSCLDCHKCPEYHDESIGDIDAIGKAVKYLREGKIALTIEELDLIIVRLNKRHNFITSRDNERV